MSSTINSIVSVVRKLLLAGFLKSYARCNSIVSVVRKLMLAEFQILGAL